MSTPQRPDTTDPDGPFQATGNPSSPPYARTDVNNLFTVNQRFGAQVLVSGLLTAVAGILSQGTIQAETAVTILGSSVENIVLSADPINPSSAYTLARNNGTNQFAIFHGFGAGSKQLSINDDNSDAGMFALPGATVIGNSLHTTGIAIRTSSGYLRFGSVAEDGGTFTIRYGFVVFPSSQIQVNMPATAPRSVLEVLGLVPYANNAAALAAGLNVGSFYRTGGDPDTVCVVH